MVPALLLAGLRCFLLLVPFYVHLGPLRFAFLISLAYVHESECVDVDLAQSLKFTCLQVDTYLDIYMIKCICSCKSLLYPPVAPNKHAELKAAEGVFLKNKLHDENEDGIRSTYITTRSIRMSSSESLTAQQSIQFSC